MAVLTVKDLKKDPEINAFISITEKQLEVLGFTEHSARHMSIVANWAGYIMREIKGTENEVRLAEIAGYLHDIGNAVCRTDHSQSGSILIYNMLVKRGMPYEEAAEIMMAIGNHDEEYGIPVSRIGSALIIADKSDVHKSRVRRSKMPHILSQKEKFITDIHDRVNYAAESSRLAVVKEEKVIKLDITINTKICPVMDYFEIYFNRMKLCRRAAEFLNMKFSLVINGVVML
ncbi:MAG: HD domain-containing protein [Clostridiales bacterium]|jgi:metal-dependent HD superfamily phosphatase/phosphodiesterase|nr:HD domain-containing protein [Clostridiales bacterium]